LALRRPGVDVHLPPGLFDVDESGVGPTTL
jgi:hypothetical protein